MLDEIFVAPYPDLHPGKFIKLEVLDTGTGMAPDILEHIFDPFFTSKKPGDRNEHILFIDDEALIADIYEEILKLMGYRVTVRTNSLEALELFKHRSHDFDLVVTDMTMPNITGDKLAADLMKIRPGIPVILCTGYSKKMSEKAALDIGIKALVNKPIVKADLAKTIRKVLDEAKETDP